MFNPISAAANIKEEFAGYISTLFHISDREYAERFGAALRADGAISKGPYLDVSDSYETGASLAQLIEEGEASPLFASLEGDIPDEQKELRIHRPLYLHQEAAIRKTNRNRNLIVTTGTGSGKTECFIIPIIHHLLREAAAGTLDAGIRAILIYPMNALANDQMKRLRNLLRYCPEIQFGVYNGSTKQTDADGVRQYGELYKDDNGRPLKPLPNEMVSRERMQATPPHILVTNYAMLEYMLLRPRDNVVFSSANLRFLVLDEAHVYRGATGIETSLLLKRLKARISNPANVLHILTSATLGGKEADSDIVTFAETLCNAQFRAEDIIRAKSVTPSYRQEAVEIPLSMFAALSNPAKPLREIAADYGVSVSDTRPDAEFLYDLCLSASVYRDLRNALRQPMTVPEITNALRETYPDITEQDTVNIIGVAAQASKNKSDLIKARYHMFAKALEGAYITLGRRKALTLNRNQTLTVDGEERKAFECAVCDDCGRIAVTGRATGGRLEFASRLYGSDADYYLVSPEGEDENDENDDLIGGKFRVIGKNDYSLCPKCGAIAPESLKDRMMCDCGLNERVKLRKADKSATRGEGKCPSCHSGTFKTFYLGYDAATAVLATALFEELPETERALTQASQTPVEKNLFAMAEPSQPFELVRRERQFLAFSDSRAEAAFFASYMSASYREFLRRRGIWHVTEKHKEDMSAHPWEIQRFVEELTAYFDSCRTFADPGDKDSNLTPVSKRNAWIAVLNEMVNARRSTSLVSLGMIQFHYKGNTEEIMAAVANKYGRSAKDVKALFDLLVMDIVYHGALQGDCSLTDDEREYIFFSPKPQRVKPRRDLDLDKKKSHIAGWAAATRGNGALLKNGRLKRVMKALDLPEGEANKLLEMYWSAVLRGKEGLSPDKNGEFYFSTERFAVSAGTEEAPVYVCDVCGRASMINCMGMCATLNCGGHLRRVTHKSLLESNHYAKLYQSSLMRPLHIREHTAQLGREEQQKYQEMFVHKELNALSCSTTFEMGVDVGDLETVYLRNVPPSPANYAQRAGRAGRGKNAAAFSLTYAKLSSHDFTYYKRPEDMITGKIGAPLFTVQNEKVVLRHIFAVALSDFFAQNEDVYNANDADVFLNMDGWERLRDYVNSRPGHLTRMLKASIPEPMHEVMGISDGSWTEKMVGSDGVLTVAVEEFRATTRYYLDEFTRLMNEGDAQKAASVQRKLQSYRRGKEDKRGKNELIEFLARNNALPRYGFPVDTAELYQNINADANNKKLQMVRDLQIAVSEYAPDAQIVADGKLYTSRYIRKLPQTTGQDWKTVFIAQCGNDSCMTWNYRLIEPDSSGETCVSCREIIPKNRWKRAIEPRKGFVAEPQTKEAPMRKPDKAYRSDDVYIGDPQRRIIRKRAFALKNGNRFLMETSANDSLMVVCDDDFYVCPKCGYAESVKENRQDAGFHSYQKTLKRKHDSPWGKSCDADLLRYKLCHTFKTDVVRLVFLTPSAENEDIMLSVMYALLEALSTALDIERNDIKGCLHKVAFGNRMIYAVVLYDAVAGGAGHVKRLATETGDKFRQALDKAIAITKGCSCSPSCYSCLRNYYNQKAHDRLNRKYAYEFLENYVGELEPTDALL